MELENKYLEREFNYNYQVHEIFKYQQHRTLDTLIKKINEKKELLLEIDINAIMPFYKHRNNFEFESDEEYDFWDHVISNLFMQELNEKYKIVTLHDIETEKRILTRDSFKEYEKRKGLLLDRNDVIETIRQLNLDSNRIHLVIRFVNNEFIWKELVNYLDDDLPFITMIYSDSDIYRFKVDQKEFNGQNLPTNVYKYKIFDKDKEGHESYRLEESKNGILKYEKKI